MKIGENCQQSGAFNGNVFRQQDNSVIVVLLMSTVSQPSTTVAAILSAKPVRVTLQLDTTTSQTEPVSYVSCAPYITLIIFLVALSWLTASTTLFAVSRHSTISGIKQLFTVFEKQRQMEQLQHGSADCSRLWFSKRPVASGRQSALSDDESKRLRRAVGEIRCRQGVECRVTGKLVRCLRNCHGQFKIDQFGQSESAKIGGGLADVIWKDFSAEHSVD